MKAATVASDRLVAFLRDPRSYPERPRTIRLLQTHASWVVLAGRHTYKVKKPVNFGFLDFSTIERRRYFCEREVALNHRLCPGVHLGVLPISIRKGRLVFGEGEAVVDYAVKMRRLPERHFLLPRLARGEIGKRHVNAIVRTLKGFYEKQTPTAKVAAWGRIAKLRISTDENFRQSEDLIGATITLPAFEAIRTFTNTFYRRHAALMGARVREGRIRDCHGDLHLEHIHLHRGCLTIYDCIEFSDRFRSIDVANDVAFLAMDFDFHDRPDLARHFATRMAAALHDPGLLRLLDFYKCYRAFVRGKVESFHARADGVPAHERRESSARAERYFRYALRYAVCGSEPAVLIVMGRVASGKSTLARLLGHELGWEVFSSDRVRKELAGVSLHFRGSDAERRRLYAPAMTSRTYSALARRALGEVRQHRGAVLDATFGNRRERDRICKTLERAGVAYCFLETPASRRTLQRRLAARSHSRDEISDARLEDFPALDRAYSPPAELVGHHLLALKVAPTPEIAVAAALSALARRASAIATVRATPAGFARGQRSPLSR